MATPTNPNGSVPSSIAFSTEIAAFFLNNNSSNQTAGSSSASTETNAPETTPATQREQELAAENEALRDEVASLSARLKKAQDDNLTIKVNSTGTLLQAKEQADEIRKSLEEAIVKLGNESVEMVNTLHRRDARIKQLIAALKQNNIPVPSEDDLKVGDPLPFTN